MKKNQSVKYKIECMADLLAQGGYDDWSYRIFDLAAQYEDEPEITKNAMLGLYGGMGSLNDLVLYRDGQVLLNENEELDKLRHELFALLREGAI